MSLEIGELEAIWCYYPEELEPKGYNPRDILRIGVAMGAGALFGLIVGGLVTILGASSIDSARYIPNVYGYQYSSVHFRIAEIISRYPAEILASCIIAYADIGGSIARFWKPGEI